MLSHHVLPWLTPSPLSLCLHITLKKAHPVHLILQFVCFLSSPKDIFIDLEEGRGGRGQERETSMGCLVHMPQLGSNPQPVCAQTGNGTHYLLVNRAMLQPNHSARAPICLISNCNIFPRNFGSPLHCSIFQNTYLWTCYIIYCLPHQWVPSKYKIKSLFYITLSVPKFGTK